MPHSRYQASNDGLIGTGAMRMSELEDENSRLVGVIEIMQVDHRRQREGGGGGGTWGEIE